MSLEDLEGAGLLLPRDRWGEPPRSRVARVPLILVGVMAMVAGVLMHAGDGTGLTWIGLGSFLLALAAFTFLSLRAIR